MASERWNKDVVYAMTPFKLLMWPLGGWPLQDYNVFSLIRCIVTTFCMGTIVILPSMEIYLGCTGAIENVDAFTMIFCGIVAVGKMIWFRIYANNLIKTYRFAVNDYLMIENAEQRVIILRHVFIAKTLMYFTVFLSYFDSTIYAISPLLRSIMNHQINITQEDIELDYTLPSRCTLKYLNAPENMYVTYCIVELIMMLLACTSNFGNDALFLYIVLHICAQAKILKSKFTNFDVTQPQMYNRFSILIERHGDLMAITKILANTTSFIFLMQLFLSCLLLCTLGFQFILALKVNDVTMMVKGFMVLNVQLAQITIYCVIGDYLRSQMAEISAVIYQSAWYDYPPKLTKNLIFIFMRSQFPVNLHAGTFIVINLETYMSILKTSVSYLSLLRVMVDI